MIGDILQVLIIITILWTGYFNLQLYKLKKKYKCSMDFHLPIIGIGYKAIGKNVIQAVFDYVCSLKDNSILHIAFTNIYCTLNPDEIEMIIQSPKSLEKSNFYKFIDALVGQALISAPVKIWKPNRRILSKSFNQAILNQFVSIFNYHSKMLMETLRENSKIELMKMFKLFSLNSFVEAAFGPNIHFGASESETFLNLLPSVFESQIERLVRPWEIFESIYALTPNGKRGLSYMKEIRDIFQPIVDKKKKLRLDENKAENEATSFKVFIDLVLDLEENQAYTEKEAMDEIVQIVAAATDTSGATLSFACVLLGMHQEVQKKLYEEIIEVIGNRELEFSDLNKLKYTERVLNETMRLFPAVPMILRRATEDLDLGTKIIEKGTDFLLGIFQIHRSEKYWPNPTRFDPDRFLPEEVAKRHPYCFIPFSAGSRNCIGMRYGYMIMKAAIANIIREFKLDTNLNAVEDIHTVYRVFLTSDNLQCTFTPR